MQKTSTTNLMRSEHDAPEIAVNALNTLPPWGQMTPALLANVSPPRVPTDFRLFDGDSSRDRLEVWMAWRSDTLERIKETLWPEYAPGTGQWLGRSAQNIVALTETDLDVMARMQSDPDGLEFERPIRSALRTPAAPNHHTFFNLEDDSDFAEHYVEYDRTLTKVVPASALQRLHNQGMLAKVSTVSSQFKALLQRPRPYQTTMLLKRSPLRYVHAASADTPSMCSGHCLQNMLAIGGILERWLEDDIFGQLPSGSDSLRALLQWAVDIGDRRVMAGVHYPSDNLASWLIFLRLAGRVYTRTEVKAKLWEAITTQSYVYRKVVEMSETGAGSVYRPVLAELQNAATGSLLQPLRQTA